MTEPAAAPVLIVHWEALLGDLLDCTQRFPKQVRFTLSSRIDGAALDILEELVDARFSHDPGPALGRASRRLERLRVLLRLSHTRRHLSHGAFERLSRALDEAGRMLGGWIRHSGGPA